MTESEAIERIRDHFEVHHHDNRPHPLLDEAVDMAIKALEEVQQYRQIGSVELFAETKKLSDLTKKCGTIGKVFDECAEYAAIGTVEEFREAVEKQTAYYPDRVVHQLKERTAFLKGCTKYGNKTTDQQSKSYDTMMMYEVKDLVDDLLEIVKAGGTNGN